MMSLEGAYVRVDVPEGFTRLSLPELAEALDKARRITFIPPEPEIQLREERDRLEQTVIQLRKEICSLRHALCVIKNQASSELGKGGAE